MAESLCGGSSDEKDPDKDGSERVARSWRKMVGAGGGKGVPETEMAETLGCYDGQCGKEERREHSDEEDADEPSLLRFMCAELTRGYFLEHNEAKYTERRERVYTCMRIPKELEKLMMFGCFLCLDAFLYVFTLLPLRTLLAFLRLLTIPCCSLGSRFLQPAQVCDLLKGLIMVLCCSMMHYVDYAMMYHLIRGQSVIKLYIIYNMLEVTDSREAGGDERQCREGRGREAGREDGGAEEVEEGNTQLEEIEEEMEKRKESLFPRKLMNLERAAAGRAPVTRRTFWTNPTNLTQKSFQVADRLISSFGQDILDALYWTATEPKSRKRAHIGVIPHFIMAVFYVFLHAILIMVQASTLNVAFNSHNKSLLTIMMSNNFVEIKGSVFKKFEKNNLFQMSNSDIKERFTNCILLLIVCLRNMEQFSWNSDHLWVLLPDVFMVVASEVAVDVVKHAFITKFNDITADVYSEYKASLAFELVSSRQQYAYTDYSDSVARRMGFIPLPLAVLLIRVVMSSVKIQGALASVSLLLFYLGLITLKVLNSIVLLGKSCHYVKEANMEGKLFNKPKSPAPKKSPGTPSHAGSPSPGDESKAQHPAPSITKQPTPRSPDLLPPAPDPVTMETSEPAPENPSKAEEDSSKTPHGTVLKHRTPKKDLLEIDRFTLCGNRIL
ncbi:transmembrane anterior posterior transformation protein 1 homolog isoform X2 [Neoarius graeffei]|uniref:transmembrane anterior posterior transformation protein 1 homolog isoform X2 n=1 Tax=Neoarius graeffei TaxID=443677 RepID=UPI00298C1B89|nr:transmembrane anterior posterior transformation protein 1 homolog isoform X2 [Neoarius graeffei]